MPFQMPNDAEPKSGPTRLEMIRALVDRLILLDAWTDEARLTGECKLVLNAAEAIDILTARRTVAERELRALGFVLPAPEAVDKQRFVERMRDTTDALAEARKLVDESDRPLR
jgi:hypothetical protein